MKVVGLDEKRKKTDDEPCQFCNTVPACRALTCPRVARFELWEDGSLAAVEYFESWKPKAE